MRVRALLIGLGLVGIAILASVTSVLGAAAAKPGPGSASSGVCTMSTGGVGQELLLTGTGFVPNTQYVLFLESPGTAGGTTVNTDQAGYFTYAMSTYSSGTYTAQVWAEGHHMIEVASCSTTVP
jgi:hypothetical protein